MKSTKEEPQLCYKEWLHILKEMKFIQKMTQQYFPQAQIQYHLFIPV